MTQPTLFDHPERDEEPEPKRERAKANARNPKIGAHRRRARVEPDSPAVKPGPYDAAAQEFHSAHPEVYRLFAGMARRAIGRGLAKFSARTIWEVIRWESTAGEHAGEFKLNDHFCPWFARKYLQEPECPPGFFELRR